MKYISRLALIFLISFSTITVHAEEDPLTKISINKVDIEQSLAQMKKDGKITDEQFNAASNDLKSMSDEHLKSIAETAKQMIRSDPERADSIWKDKTLDISKTQALLQDSTNGRKD